MRTRTKGPHGFGGRQLSILRTVSDGDRAFKTSTHADQSACLRLADRSFLKRDPQDSFRWHATSAGFAALLEQEADIERVSRARFHFA